MPSSSSSNGPRTYHALPPPQKQIKFNPRRRSVKRHAALSKLTKDQDQSTLTQLDFVSTPSGGNDLISDLSGEEFEEPQPKKKRRKSKFDGRKHNQSSLTQMDFSKAAKTVRHFDVDEDGFQIWKDYDPEDIIEDISDRQQSRTRYQPWLRHENNGQENERHGPEIPDSSQQHFISSQKAEGLIAPGSRTETLQFETPRKVRFMEIPSSQTPPSTKLSTQSSIRRNDVQQSPLGERSNNLHANLPTLQSPESQSISMKMLERVRVGINREVKSKGSTNAATTIDPPVLERAVNEDGEEVMAEEDVGSLQRADTIQDSQTEVSGSAKIAVTDFATRSSRNLFRVNTVQDSQYEESDSPLGDDINQYPKNDLDSEDNMEHDDDDTEQATFDPADSALDRDAARFGLTQTQPSLSAITEQSVEEETEDEDLDRGCAVASSLHNVLTREGAFNASSHSFEAVEAVVQLDVEKELRMIHETKAPVTYCSPHLQDDSAYQFEDLARQEEGVEIHSSPPPLRPSQISTVVPTQDSTLRSSSRRSNTCSPPYKLTMTQSSLTLPFTILDSPRKVSTSWAETTSSSPFPLPPWSSPEWPRSTNANMMSESNVTNNDVQLETLVDFSLPPPPPLSSSRRQTPTSSLSRIN